MNAAFPMKFFFKKACDYLKYKKKTSAEHFFKISKFIKKDSPLRKYNQFF